jgi:hypothetical protein
MDQLIGGRSRTKNCELLLVKKNPAAKSFSNSTAGIFQNPDLLKRAADYRKSTIFLVSVSLPAVSR